MTEVELDYALSYEPKGERNAGDYDFHWQVLAP